eukprot:4081779-Prymnesium_polylepis.1
MRGPWQRRVLQRARERGPPRAHARTSSAKSPKPIESRACENSILLSKPRPSVSNFWKTSSSRAPTACVVCRSVKIQNSRPDMRPSPERSIASNPVAQRSEHPRRWIERMRIRQPAVRA